MTVEQLSAILSAVTPLVTLALGWIFRTIAAAHRQSISEQISKETAAISAKLTIVSEETKQIKIAIGAMKKEVDTLRDQVRGMRTAFDGRIDEVFVKILNENAKDRDNIKTQIDWINDFTAKVRAAKQRKD